MKFERCVVAAAAVAVFAGCRTTKDVLDDYERNVSVADYPAAAAEVSTLAEKGDDSRLLWHLMAGGAYYMGGDKSAAIAQFDAAESVFAQNDQTSVYAQGGEGALAMMTNDRAFAYDGGGLDRSFTCLYKAIDYMTQGKAGPARTELNRAGQHQENWVWERRKDIEAAEKKLAADAAAYEGQQQAQPTGNRAEQANLILSNADFAAQVKAQSGYDPTTSGRLDALAAADYANLYALHVAGIFRWLNNDGGSVLKTAAAYQPANTVLQQDAAAAASGTRPKDQIWIWVEDGLNPSREEWRIDLPFLLVPGLNQYVLYAGMALPRLRERTFGASAWNVRAGGATTPFTDLADVDRLTQTEFDVYMRGALAREVTRTLVKVGVQVALGAAAENSGNRDHYMALKMAQLGVAAWAKTSTAADIRSWTALPKSVKVVRLTRPADGRVDIVADNNAYTLNVPASNTLVFVRKPAPSAGPTFKMVTYP